MTRLARSPRPSASAARTASKLLVAGAVLAALAGCNVWNVCWNTAGKIVAIDRLG